MHKHIVKRMVRTTGIVAQHKHIAKLPLLMQSWIRCVNWSTFPAGLPMVPMYGHNHLNEYRFHRLQSCRFMLDKSHKTGISTPVTPLDLVRRYPAQSHNPSKDAVRADPCR